MLYFHCILVETKNASKMILKIYTEEQPKNSWVHEKNLSMLPFGGEKKT